MPAPALSDMVAIKCAANSDDAVAILSSPVAKRECVAYADDNTVVSTMQQKNGCLIKLKPRMLVFKFRCIV